MPHAVSVHTLRKTYGTLSALDGLSLQVRRGTVFGLLGPNGAGKTTLVKILTTLIRPTSGDAFIEGSSVTADPKSVRRVIGVVPQENNLDRYLTARENLTLHARLHGMKPGEFNPRIDHLLELLGLYDRRNDFPDTFSGGMQRRLVCARALVHSPKVLFLDEPTTGLDPQSRRALWEYVESLKGSMTVFLTTHYMDEADALCDRIVIMDHGSALADGTAGELKDALARSRIYELELRSDHERYEELMRGLPFVESLQRTRNLFRLTLKSDDAVKPLLDAVKSGDLRKICLQEPSLEEVFLELTGKKIRN
ncbi:MAG TPA: ATP-binding cassette domain-containing protein [Verrucomicrobiae bacterium]|nr:ATP-binding cassette domain-containing protein [Verrucomicrobiae bacterium]